MKKIIVRILYILIASVSFANEFYNGFDNSSFKSIVFKSLNKVSFYNDADDRPDDLWNNDFDYSLSNYEKACILSINNENCIKRFYALKSDYCLILYDCETNECIFTGVSISFNKTEGLFFPVFISATSELREGNKVYSVQNLSNFKSDSPWCEASENYGIGEKVRLSINARKLVIISGYVSAKRIYLYEDNSRPKIIVIDFKKSKIQKEYELKDTPSPQIIDFDGLFNEEIEIAIKDVYPGRKYKDTCISTLFSVFLE